jgi:glucose-1-phosphate thymidylyltransferase
VKALVLAGGAGTRLRPITYTSAKQLVPVANRPILFYGLDALRDAGVTETVVVVGDTATEVQAALGDGSTWGMRFTFVHQEAPLGLAHAVLVSRDALGDGPFVMFLGDNLLEEPLVSLVTQFLSAPIDTAALVLLAAVADPRRFGVAKLDADGRLVGLVEKPDVPPSDLALVGVYLFDDRIHDAVRAIRPSARGELEITDAISWLLTQGWTVEHRRTNGWWIDTGKLTPLLEANRLVLDRLARSWSDDSVVDGVIDSTVSGPVRIEPGAVVRGSTLIGPVVIGSDAVIEVSTVGPYVSVGDRSRLSKSTVVNSVLMNDVEIDGVGPIADSLLGRSVSLRQSDRPGTTSLLIGDHSQVWL